MVPTDPNLYAHSVQYTRSHRDADAHRDADTLGDANSDRDDNPDRYGFRYANDHLYGDANWDSDRYTYTYEYS
jgi:hypothetical protein